MSPKNHSKQSEHEYIEIGYVIDDLQICIMLSFKEFILNSAI